MPHCAENTDDIIIKFVKEIIILRTLADIVELKWLNAWKLNIKTKFFKL